MQRGDRVVWVAILGMILIIAIVAIVMRSGSTAGVVLARKSYNPEAMSIVCDRVVCEAGPALYLGRSNNYVTCCCPENYIGGRLGDCTRPLNLMI